MKCSMCSSNIERPLELYNGRWCCPSCKKDIFPDVDTEFAITPRNRELFVRSEEYYFKWLTSTDESKSTRFKYLDKAVSLCYESAFEYHPSALMRLGYYYERGYADFNTSSAERWRVAYFYYKALLFNTHKGVNAEGGEERFADDLTQIKLQCGEYMQGLLRDIPQELLQKTSFDGYESFDKLRKSVADKITDLGGDAEDLGEVQTRSLADMSSMAYATLRACVDEERAPVFAIFKLQRYECQKLFLESEDGFSVVGNVGRDMVIKIVAAFDDKEIDGRFKDFKSSNALVDYVNDDCPESGVYVCFINWLGGHKYLKKRDRANIVACLEDNSHAAIKKLIRAGKYNNCVFYDDDFYKFDEGRKGLSKKEVDRFVREVCEEE